jgi:acetate---CoA ligase (ADP-forming)
VAISSLSGGVRGLAADNAERLGLPLATLQPSTIERLDSLLGVGSGVGNPLDVGWGGLASLDTYLGCLRALFEDPGVDVVGVQEELPKSQAAMRRATGFQAMVDVAREYDKSLLFYSRGSYVVSEFGREFHRGCEAPFLQELNRTLEAIGQLRWYEQQRPSVEAEPALPTENALAATWRERLAAAGGPLDDRQAYALLEDWGLPVPEWHLASMPTGAVAAADVLGFPLALKLSAPGLTHKTELGGVRLNLASSDDVEQAAQELLARAPSTDAELLVQRMAPPGIELLVSCRRDPQFGPLIVVGLGGVWVEALRAVRSALAPLNPERARRLIESIPGSAILSGLRGQPPADIDALVDTLVRLSELALMLGPQLDTLEINPFILGPRGQGGFAVDVVVLPGTPDSVSATAH